MEQRAPLSRRPDARVLSTAENPNRRALQRCNTGPKARCKCGAQLPPLGPTMHSDHLPHIPTDICARSLTREPVAGQVFQSRKIHLYGDFKKSTHGRPHLDP
jgi:hypothetical protein